LGHYKIGHKVLDKVLYTSMIIAKTVQ